MKRVLKIWLDAPSALGPQELENAVLSAVQAEIGYQSDAQRRDPLSDVPRDSVRVREIRYPKDADLAEERL